MKTAAAMLMAALVFAAAIGCAHAGLDFGLVEAVQPASPGATAVFSCVLRNTGAGELWLNGAGYNIYDQGIEVDYAKFFTNTPLSLQSGESWTGEIFDVVVPESAIPGEYTGVFSIFGGTDPGSQDTLASENFMVSVISVPEPASLLALSSILAGLALRRRSARTSR